MTYHPLGATPEELRARLTTTAGTAATAELRRIQQSVTGAGTWAQIPKPDDIVQIPSTCEGIRIASFEAWERHEPPAYIPAKGGLLMFTVQIDPRWLANYPDMNARAQQMMDVVRGIQNRMRPQIFDWKRANWYTRVTGRGTSGATAKGLARSMLQNAGNIAKPTDDTAWALNWNHAGPALKKPRHITGINSMPPELFEQLLEQQTDAAAAESLSWLHSVQPGYGGILPKQGVLWFSVEVLKDPRLRLGRGLPERDMPTIPPGTTGASLLAVSPTPFDTDFLVHWATRLASQELRDHRLGSLAIAIPSWIPGVWIDGMARRGYEAPTSHDAGSWRNDTTRTLRARWENRRLNMAGYYGAPVSQVIEEKKTRASSRLPSNAVSLLTSDERHRVWKAGNDSIRNVGDVTVVGGERTGTAAVVNVGSTDQAVIVDYTRGLDNREGFIPPDEINRLYDIASVMASGWVDILVPFFSYQLIGPKTDRSIREEFNRWRGRTDRWINIQRWTTNHRTFIANALGVGEQAFRLKDQNPAIAMQLVNGAIEAIEYIATNLQKYAGEFTSGGWATADIDGQVERVARSAIRTIRTGLTTALDQLQRRLTSGATESQRLHATCVLYKKANQEGRTWPVKLRAFIPTYENARSAAIASMPHVPAALTAYRAALQRLYFIKSQIPLPWWQRRFGPMPVWGWGAVGVTGFLGGAVALRRRRKKRLGKTGGKVKKNLLVRRTSR